MSAREDLEKVLDEEVEDENQEERKEAAGESEAEWRCDVSFDIRKLILSKPSKN